MAKKTNNKFMNELPLSKRAKKAAEEFIRELTDVEGTIVFDEDAELIQNFAKWLDSKGYLKGK